MQGYGEGHRMQPYSCISKEAVSGGQEHKIIKKRKRPPFYVKQLFINYVMHLIKQVNLYDP